MGLGLIKIHRRLFDWWGQYDVESLDMGAEKITSVGEGTDPTDAVNKSQLDAAVGGLGDTKTDKILRGKVTLSGASSGLTEVPFGAATPGTKMGSVAGPWDLHSVGDGGTLIMNPDGDGNQTATLNAAAGYHTGGAGASEDMTSEVDTKFNIAVDGGDPQEVTCVWTGCNSGALIAAQLQSAIRALGGTFANVTVTFSTDHYVITSSTLGTSSSIEISPGDDHDCTEELKLGTANGGTSTQGTGDCADITNVTPGEMITLCEGDMSGLVVSQGEGDDAGKLVFTSDSVGGSSSILVGNGTLDTALGFVNAEVDYGAAGLGYDGVTLAHSGDDEYTVFLTKVGVAQGDLGADDLGVLSKSASGFNIACETAASSYQVDVLVMGKEA